MSGQGDDKAERLLERAVARKPADVLALLDVLRQAMPAALELREGAVHPIVHRLVRTDRLLTGGRSQRGLSLYRAPGTAVPTGLDPLEPLEPGTPGRTHKVALRVAGAVRDPAARGRILSDVTAHLEALDEAGHRHRFGSPRSVRYLLQRVDRQRPTVCVTSGAGDSLRRFLLHEGPWIFGAVLLFFVLKLFIIPIYRIPSESMLPSLQVGDRVAVFLPHIGGVPDRWRIVTYEKGGVTYVKRLVGLPGEEIAILHGDVFVDGKLLVKPDDVRQALRSSVGRWDFRADTPRGWSRPDDAHDERMWQSRAFPAHPPPHKGGMARGNSYVLRDGYVRLSGDRGERGALILTLQRGPGGSVDESVEWTLEAGLLGITLREERFRDGTRVEASKVLASRGAPPAAGATRLELSYVDGVLRASCADWSWRGPRAAPDAALGVRVAQRGPGSRVLDVALDRDIHYAHLGTQGVPQAGQGERNPHQISKHGMFCLGDNTTDSRDSRYREPGDIPVEDLIGAVRVRIWPPSRIGPVR